MPAQEKSRKLFLVGYASGLAGPDPQGGEGPVVLQQSAAMAALSEKGLALHWESVFKPDNFSKIQKTQTVTRLCQSLSDEIARLVQENKFFVVLGGDHTCAIGTFSGMAKARSGQPGLLWIDAHMDSHTPQTTHTGNLHGMPLACLLGQGEPGLTHLAGICPVLDPAQVCLVGVRSFEPEEEALLKQLGVRIYFMDEVRARGLRAVFEEAKKIVSKSAAGYGITLDIDSIDPEDAPGTGVSEPGGLRGAELCEALKQFAGDPGLAGIEITEFDPHLDRDRITEKLIPQLVLAIVSGRTE